MPKLPNIAAVTTEELAFAYGVGGAAASGQTPQSGVSGMGLNLVDGDKVHAINFTDTPTNRAIFAIRDQFPKGMLMPLMARVMALVEMLQLPEAERYFRAVPGKPEHQEFSEALFHVAAKMPLNAKLSFARKQFFAQVATKFAQDPDLD